MNGSSSLDFRRDGNVFDWIGPDQNYDGPSGAKRHTGRLWRGTLKSEENPRSCPVPRLSRATRHTPGLAWGFEKKTDPGYRQRGHHYVECIWGKRMDRMVHFTWTEAYPKRFKWWGAGRGGWLHCHPGTWWCLGLSCCPGPCLGSWPWYSHSLCWSPRLDNAKGRKCRAVQSCSLLLTVLTLGRIDPAPHQVTHSGERVLYFTWAAQ